MQVYLCKKYITVIKTGDGWTHGSLYCGHGYVPLKCGEYRDENWISTSKTGV